MAEKCDCGDQECAICCGRTRAPKFVDPYLAAKAEQDKQSKPGTVVVQERALVAQLADTWTPPKVDDIPPAPVAPPVPAEAAIAELAGLSPAQVTPTRTPKQQSAYARAYVLWQAECTRRNEWIAGLYKEYQDRLAKRAAALAQWDAHVAEAKTAWQQGKLTSAPPAPRKEDFSA